MKSSLTRWLAVLILVAAGAGCSAQGQAAPQAALAGGGLERRQVYDGNESLPAGQLNWKLPVEQSWGSTPVIAQGLVLAHNSGTLYALDARTGQAKWIFPAHYVGSDPALWNDLVYFGSMDYALRAVDAKTGVERWNFKTQGFIFSSPAVADGTLYFGSYDGHLYALDAATGTERWRFKTLGLAQPFHEYDAEAEEEMSGAVGSAPALAGGTLYFTSHDGHLYAVEAATGNEKWNFNAGGLISNPGVAQGVIYFGGFGYFYAVQDGGQLKWQVNLPDSGTASSAAITDEVVYFVSSLDQFEPLNNHAYYLYAVSAATGDVLWKVQLPAYSRTPSYTSGVLYFGNADGLVLAVDAKNGQTLWQFQADSAVVGEVTIVGGRAYFCTQDGYLYALE
jgi:outer membrane protein assembly factor BamB